ncbi:MAG: ATP-dependent DNA helicase RecG [Candidatus Planktophila sp.]
MATFDSKLSGVLGDRTAKAFKDFFGYTTLGDLLHHFPRRYLVRGELSDIKELREGDEATILAKVYSVQSRRFQARKGTMLEAVVTDGTEKLSLTFFNQAWREKDLKVGSQGLFAGKVGVFNTKKQLTHPDYEMIPDGNDVDSAVEGFANQYIPIYPSTAKLPSWKIAQCIELALAALDDVEDPIPAELLEKNKYPTIRQALVQIHKPEDLDAEELARERLTFDEALLLQLLLLKRKVALRALDAVARPHKPGGLLDAFDKTLPFELTAGQKSVSAEIAADLAASHPMHRLLQGEVGSGKTIIALRAALTVIDNGGQVALLAPTEVLAAQHVRTFTKLLGGLAEGGMLGASDISTSVVLLTGSQNAATRREVLAQIKSGSAGIVVGTHALLGDTVEFQELALVIVDEQHRFGVEQRDALKSKAVVTPHLLVMTATPIPRTVAMTIFGDLDVSTLRELPLGRQVITSHLVPVEEKPHFLERSWQRVREEVAQGHQVYIVAPRISAGISEDADFEFLEGESTSLTAVEELGPELQSGALKGLRIAPLHGRQSADVKDETMKAFAAAEIDVLVSTTVIEVGVDVPNATLMIIMDADRFGVSQLHQLRGRVGRGTSPGLCLLVTKSLPDSPARARLEAVASTNDGFELSRIDLEQRREGDVLGTSQSGSRSHLRLLRVLRDEALIEVARSEAEALISAGLSQHSLLEAALTKLELDTATEFIDKS